MALKTVRFWLRSSVGYGVSAFLFCVLFHFSHRSVIAGPFNQDEFDRLTSCVRGAMPLEVQFVRPGNPPISHQRNLGPEYIAQVEATIDARIRRLLADSAGDAWRATGSESPTSSGGKMKEFRLELLARISDRAARSLGIEFCGSTEDVGSAVLANISEYFGRAVRAEGGGPVEWARRLENPSRAATVLIVAVSLHAAGIPAELEDLASVLGK